MSTYTDAAAALITLHNQELAVAQDEPQDASAPAPVGSSLTAEVHA